MFLFSRELTGRAGQGTGASSISGAREGAVVDAGDCPEWRRQEEPRMGSDEIVPGTSFQ